MKTKVMVPIGLAVLSLCGLAWLIVPSTQNQSESMLNPSDSSPINASMLTIDTDDIQIVITEENAIEKLIVPQNSSQPNQDPTTDFVSTHQPTLSTKELNSLIQNSLEEIKLEEGLSSFNLMIIQHLASRLSEINNPTSLSNQYFEGWPDNFLDATQKLIKAAHAEQTLMATWKDKIATNIEGYREAFLAEQKNILGKELFSLIHPQDTMIVDSTGLNAAYLEKQEAAPEKNSFLSKSQELVALWQNNKLTETELKNTLATQLNADEINQVMESSKLEKAWLTEISNFLEEYHYIEQAGIAGEDEQIMRQELLEKHLSPENRQTANQFLFGQR